MFLLENNSLILKTIATWFSLLQNGYKSKQLFTVYEVRFGIEIIWSIHLGARCIITTASDPECKSQHANNSVPETAFIYSPTTHRIELHVVTSTKSYSPGQWPCGTSFALQTSPVPIPVINRCFSVSGFSSNSVSTVATPLTNSSITGRHCVELNLAISI
jgi:hypothetical protein